jgi:hypothetical protein
MKVGISISMINTTAKRDEEIYRDELAIANLAEPLGFDSIGAMEHHFTGYAMIPNCTIADLRRGPHHAPDAGHHRHRFALA